MPKAKAKVETKVAARRKAPFGAGRWIITKARYLRMLAPFISKEETRYYLQGIHVEPAPKGIFLVATDGHRMGVIHDENGTCGETFICPISQMSLAAIKKMGPETTAAFAGDILHLIKNLDSAKAIARKDAEKSADYSERLPAIDGTYPNWKCVIEDTQKGAPAASLVFTLNSRYVADFGKVFTEGGFKGSPGLSFFQTQGEYGPMFVRIQVIPEFLGVQMPMRGGVDKPLPDWLPIKVEPAKALPKKKAA